MRDYNDLMGRALKLGIKLPDSYYVDGKIKGKTNRDKHVDGPRTPEKAQAPVRKIALQQPIDLNIHSDEALKHHFQRPSMNEMPAFIEKGKATEIPSFLEGFKPNKRKL